MIKKKHSRDFKTYYQNVRGLKSKTDSLAETIDNYEPTLNKMKWNKIYSFLGNYNINLIIQNFKKYILKITNIWRRWGTPQNFFLAFTDELEKQLIIKNCWSEPIKHKIILIFTMLYLKKKGRKKNTCRYHYQNIDDMIYMIYSFWDDDDELFLWYGWPTKGT